MNTNVFPMADALTGKLTMRSLGFSPNDASPRSALLIGFFKAGNQPSWSKAPHHASAHL